MKFFLKVFVLIAIALGIYLLVWNLNDSKDEIAQKMEKAGEIDVRDFGVKPRFDPSKVVQATPGPTRESTYRGYAKALGLEIVEYSEMGPNTNVAVRWISDRSEQGMDLIDDLINKGEIRDFQMARAMQTVRDPQGRTVRTMFFVLVGK